MNRYTIESRVSGQTIGTFEGETERDALNAMARDQGYQDFRDLCGITDPADLDAKVESEVASLLITKVVEMGRSEILALVEARYAGYIAKKAKHGEEINDDRARSFAAHMTRNDITMAQRSQLEAAPLADHVRGIEDIHEAVRVSLIGTPFDGFLDDESAS